MKDNEKLKLTINTNRKSVTVTVC